MTQVPYIISKESINVMLKGNMYNIPKTHPFFDKLKEELKGDHDVDSLEKLASIPNAIEGELYGDVTIADGAIYYKNAPVNNLMTTRIIELIKEGFDVKPWANFMDNVMKNPVESARNELFIWLEKSGMPITTDGHFIAFKYVRSDYSSFHRAKDGSKVFNYIGEEVSMEEDEVDRNRSSACSTGLHFCSKEYLPSQYIGGESTGVKVLILDVNPADVRAIPSHEHDRKGRAVKYTPIGEVKNENECDTVRDKVVFEKKIIEEEKPKISSITFITKDGYEWTCGELLEDIACYESVRSFSRGYDIPESTARGWYHKAREITKCQ